MCDCFLAILSSCSCMRCYYKNCYIPSTIHSNPTCMCPPVSLQLVTPGEPFPTEHPVADKGSLAAVPAQVSSEM